MPALFPAEQVAKLVRVFFCGWSSFRNNDTSTNLQKFPSNMAEGVLSHVSVERRHPGV